MRSILFSGLLFSLLVTGNCKAQLWKPYTDSAQKYVNQKNYEQAIQFYLKARERQKRDPFPTIYHARTCDSIGFLYFRLKDYTDAEKYYLEGKQMKLKLLGSKSSEYAGSCDLLGKLYQSMENYTKAEPLFLEAKRIRQNTTGTSDLNYANSCANLCALYYLLGEYAKSEPLCETAKQLREKILGKESLDYASSCVNFGLLCYYKGEYRMTESFYLEALQIYEKLTGKDDALYATVCDNLANTYSEMGLPGKAEPLYLQSKIIREKVLGKESPEYARSCNNLGTLYDEQGEYEKAEGLHLEALQIREKVLGKDHSDYAQTCINLGIIYWEIGQFAKSEKFFLEAKQIREKIFGRSHPDYANACDNLAQLYIDMDLLEKAETLLIAARRIWKSSSGTDNLDYAASCSNLAFLYGRKGEYGKALPFALECKSIYKKSFGKERWDYAECCNNLGQLYQQQYQYTKAVDMYRESKEITARVLGTSHRLYALDCEDLAGVYRLLGNPAKAEKEFFESSVANKEMLDKVFRFTNENEKMDFIRRVIGEDNKIYSLYTATQMGAGLPYSLSLFRRNLILQFTQRLKKEILAGGDTILASKYDQWMNLRKDLSRLYTTPADQRYGDPAVLEEKADALEKELSHFSDGFTKNENERRITWETIRENLKENEATIEFIDFQYHDGNRWADSIYYSALLLRKDRSEPEMVKLFEKRQLDSLFNDKNTIVGQQRINYLYAKNEKSNESIYDLVWKPLEDKLTGINTVYFAPAGSLFKISFAALPVTATQTLSDKYRMIQLNTTASMMDTFNRGISPSDKVIIYGAVQYDEDSLSMKEAAANHPYFDIVNRSLPEDLLREGGPEFYYLKGTEIEVAGIKSLARGEKYQVTTMEGIAATEESFKSLTGGDSPSVLHIATHGFFFPDPKSKKKNEQASGVTVFRQSDNPLIRSGLALAGANNAWKGKPITGVEDGILTAYEVSDMYLPNTKLAVLSACETGLGDIQGSEGVYGLQRAFKMAGVQYLVMSLWKVPDVETAEFMREFYKNLFNKETISDAFYHAQTVMKNKHRSDPYKWAAWILLR